MFRLLLWWVDSGTRRCIAVHFVMSTAVIGAVTMIVTGSIVFHVSVGTGASSGHGAFEIAMKSGGSSNEPPEVTLSDDMTEYSSFLGVGRVHGHNCFAIVPCFGHSSSRWLGLESTNAGTNRIDPALRDF
jgi:hypothetical protein